MIHQIVDKNVAIPVLSNKLEEHQICLNASIFICWTRKINWATRNWILWGVAIQSLKKKSIFLVLFLSFDHNYKQRFIKIKIYLKIKIKNNNWNYVLRFKTTSMMMIYLTYISMHFKMVEMRNILMTTILLSLNILMGYTWWCYKS